MQGLILAALTMFLFLTGSKSYCPLATNRGTVTKTLSSTLLSHLIAGGSRRGPTAATRGLAAAAGDGQLCSPPNTHGTCGTVVTVPIFGDNYAYLLHDPSMGRTAALDPADPEKMLAAADAHGLTIDEVWCTHHHADHAGGNAALAARLGPGLAVRSTAYDDRIPAVTDKYEDGAEFKFGSLNVKVLYTPCHTRGHVLFYVTGDTGDPILFSGDTVFVGGCGRFFEGTAAQMTKNLMEVVAKLPSETKIFCSHEYTMGNLAFAKSIEPENSDLLSKIEWSKNQLENEEYTVPSTVGGELAYNPFMRVDMPSVQAAVGAVGDPVKTMAALREGKNNF